MISPIRALASLRSRLAGRGLKAIGVNSGWLMGEKLARMFIGAVVTAWVARYLGPGRFATIAFAFALCTFLLPLAQLGLLNILIRNISQRPENSPSLLGTALLLRATSGLACMILLILGLAAASVSGEDLLVAVLVGFQLIFQAADVFEYWFQSRLESRTGAIVRTLVTVFVSIAKLAMIWTGMSIWEFALVTASEFLLVAFGMSFAYLRHPMSGKLSFSSDLARAMLSESAYFILAGLAVAAYMRVDHLLIRHFLGPDQLGIFSAIVPLTTAWHFVPAALLASLAPSLSRNAETNPAKMHQTLRAAFLLVAGLSMVYVGFIVLMSPLIIDLLLGKAYASAANVLKVYVFTNVFVALGSAWNIWATTTGNGRLVLVNTVAGALVSIAANWLLIPQYGIMGAAIAANLSFATTAFLMNFFTCRKIFFMQIGYLRD